MKLNILPSHKVVKLIPVDNDKLSYAYFNNQASYYRN